MENFTDALTQPYIGDDTSGILPLVLNGDDLDIDSLGRLLRDERVEVHLDPQALMKVRSARQFLHSEAASNVVYGVNTGFGPMASHVIGAHRLAELQTNLVRSHATGMGSPIRNDYVLAAMVVRLNTLIKGYSGVSPELLIQLQQFINHRIIPVVPEHGAVGTSGDLVQLAHIALALIGEGRVSYQSATQECAFVLRQCDLAPHELEMKEGLALINGTSMMTAIAAILVDEATQLLGIAVRNSALALELVGAYEDGISSTLHALRPHPGQITIARMLRGLLGDSGCLRTRKLLAGENRFEGNIKVLPESVQEIYSLRCSSQVLGPIHDAIVNTRRVVDIELNSVTDNPVVDQHGGAILHGGNFHGDYVAFAVDQLKIALVKLSMLSERRTNFFLSAKTNQCFPPFMNLGEPGLTLGLQGLQFVATSTVSQNQTLAFPQYVHSIPTNGDNQDIVSMGTDAGLLAMKVVENTFKVAVIEAVTLAQGVDFLGNESRLSSESRWHFGRVRERLPVVVEDRVLIDELLLLEEQFQSDRDLRIASNKNTH